VDLNRIVSILKILANPHRASIVRVLHEKGRCSFAEIMQEIGLDPKRDCGVFGYNLAALIKAHVVRRSHRGLYSLTERGETIWSLIQQVSLAAEESPELEESSVAITRFGEEDIDDYARFMGRRIDRDPSQRQVETIARHNYFVDGSYGSFD